RHQRLELVGHAWLVELDEEVVRQLLVRVEEAGFVAELRDLGLNRERAQVGLQLRRALRVGEGRAHMPRDLIARRAPRSEVGDSAGSLVVEKDDVGLARTVEEA